MKINELLYKVNNSRIIRIGICIGLVTVIIIVYFILLDKITYSYSGEIGKDQEIVFFVENVNESEKSITLSGYCFRADSNIVDMQMFLRSTSNPNEEIWLDVRETTREDVANYYADGEKYQNSGFEAKISKNQLQNENDVYEIVIKLRYRGIRSNGKENIGSTTEVVATGKYYCNCKVTAYHPNNFVPFKETANDEFNQAVNKGELCFYRPDAGITLYIYADKCYWVANDNFQFYENGRTMIYYYSYTTNIHKLPSELQELGVRYEPFKVIFENNMLSVDETIPYKVAVTDLPKGYPILYIDSGVYDGTTWIWTEKAYINEIH